VVPSIFMGIPVFGTTEGWIRAHSGGIVNALLIIAIAFALPHCRLAPGYSALYAKGMVFVGWANAVFYWFGNASANDSLSFSDNTLDATNILATFGCSVAVIAAFVIIVVVVQMARGFFA